MTLRTVIGFCLIKKIILCAPTEGGFAFYYCLWKRRSGFIYFSAVCGPHCVAEANANFSLSPRAHHERVCWFLSLGTEECTFNSETYAPRAARGLFAFILQHFAVCFASSGFNFSGSSM